MQKYCEGLDVRQDPSRGKMNNFLSAMYADLQSDVER